MLCSPGTKISADRSSKARQRHRRIHADRDTSLNRLAPQVVGVVDRLGLLLKSFGLYQKTSPEVLEWVLSCDGTSDYLLRDCGSVGHRHRAMTADRLDPQVVREVHAQRLDPQVVREVLNATQQEVVSNQRGWFRPWPSTPFSHYCSFPQLLGTSGR